MIKFKRIAQAIPALKNLQANIERAFKQVNDEPFVRGFFITITVTTTDQFDLATGIMAEVSGWVCVETNVAVDFYRVKTDRDEVGILTLKPDNAGTFTFWVF